MVPKLRQIFSFGAIAALSVGTLASTAAWAQPSPATITNLTENPTLIRGCRQLNQTVAVFDNSSLGPVSNRIGTLQAGTPVTLTGVVAPGRAQVFLGNGSLSSVQPVGWVNAGALTACGTPQPVTRACFRANQALVVRSSPMTTASSVAGYNLGDTVISSTNPPTQQTASDGRIWMQVTIFDGRTGWVARTGFNGLGSNLSSTTCP